MVGRAGRTVQYPKSELETLADLHSAISSIGKVVEIRNVTMSVTGKVRLRFFAVTLRVTVLPLSDERSLIEIQGVNHLWRHGTQRGADNLLRALGSPVEPW